MRSPQKVMRLLDHVQDMSDRELGEAFPLPMVPTPVIRSAIELIRPQIPTNPDELDAWLERVSEFCSALKTDDPALTA